MTDLDVTTSFAVTLVDEWARRGVTHAVVAPGSRNTPLVLALARDARITVDVVLDERSAAFRALGIGIASGRPAIVCCTSGTAATNFHPAVVEAHHARVPLLVCTADRPPELRGVGAPQTIDQTNLYGRAVNWFHDPGPPDAAHASRWRALAARAVDTTLGSPRGPVHLNLPFPEPLLPTGAPLLDVPATVESPTARAVATVAVDLDESVARIGANRRGLVVAGFGAATDLDRATGFAEAAGWPLLADPISQLRGPGTISTYEALVRASAFAATHRPDLVVRVGAPLTSKAANAWLADVPHILIDADGIWRDPDRTAALRLHADPNTVLAALSDALALTASVWRDDWSAAEERVRAAIDAELDAEDTPCEARIARDIARATKDTLVVASSLPVRALEWTMAPRADLRVLANRGANGIDGFVSTALGIARATRSQVTALCGDLCFLHDIGALATADANTRVRFVVIDNGGGGIFSYLPQHDLPRDEFERLFLTPARVDIAAVAQAYQRGAVEVEVLTVDGEKSRVRHARMWEAAASAFS